MGEREVQSNREFSSAELKAQELVAIADSDMMAHNDGHLGRLGGENLIGACGRGSQVVRYYAHQNDIEARMLQVKDIHCHFGGQSEADSTLRRQSFVHGMTVAAIDDEHFLFDLTFGQFCGKETVRQFDARNTGVPVDDPFVTQLITDGYVPLNDENLRKYLYLTSADHGADRSYINEVTVGQVLAEIPEALSDIPADEIASGLEWHMGYSAATCAEQTPPCVRPNPTITGLGASALSTHHL